ncbi:MAG: right-handed parallel beta-helix repeat-containing protein, partial [Actinomycetota bacterium]
VVLEGDYSSYKTIITRSGSSTSPVTFQAQGLVTTRGFIVSADYIAIRWFDISDTSDHRVNSQSSHDWRGGTGIFVEGNACLLEENTIHYCVWSGVKLYKSGTFAAPTDCIVRKNRLFKNGMSGIEVSGRNHLIDGNEIWATIQHHPKNVEHTTESWLDADGIRFFGQGHTFRKNYIHDIKFGPPGTNPANDDYNDDPHIDCFQTWTGTSAETAKDIVFEGNWCDNAQGQAANETGQGFMIEGPPPNSPTNLIVRNNVIRAYRGMNVLDATGIIIVNNTFVNDLSLPTDYHPSGVGFSNSPNATIKNNLFFDMSVHTIILKDATSQSAQTGKNLSYRSDGKPLVTNDSYYGPSRRAADLWGVNPLLKNPGAAPPDYHLSTGSPAIDAAEDLPSLVSNDYDGVARPQQSHMDIGAFEYLAPP